MEPVEPPDGMLTVHCLVSGRVQGVWFRQSTCDQARSLGVAGWVRNLDDGRVEALLQGPPEAVGAVLAWMRAGGPPGAEVAAVETTEGEPDDRLAGGFELRR